MSGNRVEELEAKVRELEATIQGLTDELVETKERLEAIEEETGVTPDVFESRHSGQEQHDEVNESTEEETTTEEETADGSDGDGTSSSESGDDIIVA